MGMKWTKRQEQVIRLRKRNGLISAAAGSGKTAVLVERIIQMISDEKNPVDIDRLLVVTFTNAAAAEMRERIGLAIEKALDEQPENEHLQKQLTLIHNAQITTIDSFCLQVVRNHFYEIPLEPGFRIGDEGELKLLREDVMRGVLEAHYANPEEDFLAFMDGYASAKSDSAVTEMIEEIYHFSRSYPWPNQWLASCMEPYDITDVNQLNEAAWMKQLVKHMQLILEGIVKELSIARTITQEADGPYMYEKAIQSDMDLYSELAKISEFTKLSEKLLAVQNEKFATSRGFDGDKDKLERVKAIRAGTKKSIENLASNYCYTSASQMVSQIKDTRPMISVLLSLTKEFADAYAREKRKKNLVDFSDMEHFALEILLDEEGNVKKTAEEYQELFAEIMIDEYQDSNYVQEAILTAISRMKRGENNIFMVGDVKQSIYRFRLARPELFMEKYDQYTTEESPTQRIDLHQNFRSRQEVLELTNDVFYRIMGRDLGKVIYDEEAALHLGASYPHMDHMKPEVLLTDAKDDLLDDTDLSDKMLLEAKMVANKIKQLVKEQYVTDKKTGEPRRARYSDMVILLRSLTNWADAFAKLLNEEGIPAHAVSSTGYFKTVEIETILAMLRILDNPRQDIPLAAVLRSPIVNLRDEELAKLRLLYPKLSFHAGLLACCKELEERPPKTNAEEKLYRFYQIFKKLRAYAADTPIHTLLEMIVKETGYENYVAAMPAGERRLANLSMLIEKAIAYEKTSYKGLFHFIRYIDELQKYKVDFGEADLVGENENVVRIMSIHKSKGLEFPIVFVSGLGKKFNKQDVRSRLVLHPEYGIGLDFIDGRRQIKSTNIMKCALAKQIELENIGEELRVLYVALTRAKEKLILTGSQKEVRSYLAEKERAAKEEKLKERELFSYRDRETAGSYLDWIIKALLSYEDKYEITVVEAKELVAEEITQQMEDFGEKEERLARIAQADEELVARIAEGFKRHYPYEVAKTQKNKYSVSELKHRAMREVFEASEPEAVPVFLEEDSASYIPKFMREDETGLEEGNKGALRGTAVHRVMECFDFTKDTTVEEQVADMVKDTRLTEKMLDLVSLSKVQAFVASDLGMRMKQAAKKGLLFKEKPFVMGFSSEELRDFGFEEEKQEDLVLIQGIIDVFFEEEDGLVLLDYKTDYVQKPEELIDRYKAQLELYSEAINRVYAHKGLKVKEKLLYAFRFGEILSI